MNTYPEYALESGWQAPGPLSREASVFDSEKVREQGERMCENLRVFVGEKLLSDHALTVARLQGHVDTIRDESAPLDGRSDMAWQLMDYLTDPSLSNTAEDVDYMFWLWRDLPRIDAIASHYRSRLENHGTERSREVLEKLDGMAELSEDDWRDIRIGVDVPTITDLSQHVNVESILIRSAPALDRVATATVYDRSVLKDILEIETVYAPLLDLLGLHANEATLRHHAEKARLMASGSEEARQKYDEISEYTESVRESELVNKVITDIVGVDLEEYDFGFIIDNKETAYGSKSYFSAIRYVSAAGTRARYISRIKSPGSSTEKALIKNGGQLPQDIYAGTVVVETIDEMVTEFKDVYATIQSLAENGVCELVSAKSKESPVHVKGQNAYIEAVRSGLGDEFAADIDIAVVDEEVNEPFQVLKVTFNISDGDKILPVEIQFQTVEDRNRSRLGGASHLGHKGKNGDDLPGNEPGDSSDLWKVNNRKWAMLEGGEGVYYDTDPDAEKRQLEEVRELQELVMDACFR